MLSVENICLSYGDSPALVDVSLSGVAGESLAIVGPSGCGKTSLLYCMAGLQYVDAGSVVIDGLSLNELNERQRSDLRLRSLGFVFQSSELIAELSLQENIALPLELMGHKRKLSAARASDLCHELGISESMKRRPSEVSGGQRQRAAIARSVSASPKVVFADEPTGALDSDNRDLVLDLLIRAVRVESALLVLVTHDLTVADRLSRIIEMKDGKIIGDRVTDSMTAS